MTAANASQRGRDWRYIAGAAAAAMVGACLLMRASCAHIPDVEARTSEAQLAESSPDDVPREGAAIAPSHTTSSDAGSAHAATSQPHGSKAVGTGSIGLNAAASADARARTSSIPAVDSRELPLLASIERDLKRDPPPEVHALLAEYRGGADRAALIRFVQQRFPKDLPLRVLALRWIDDVRPSADGVRNERPQAPSAGSGPGWVTPIRGQSVKPEGGKAP